MMAPSAWARVVFESQLPTTDSYVDAHVDDPEVLVHLPLKGDWRSYLRVFVISSPWVPDDLWIAHEQEAWPPNLEEEFADVICVWEDFCDQDHGDDDELPAVPVFAYPPHRYT